MKQLDFHLLNS